MGQMGFFSYRTSMKIRNNTIQAASMCRLDTDTTGKEVDQPDDVLSSSRYMLGRGVKRKRSRSEGEEERVPGPQAPDRQLILDLCLSKLHSCYAQAEPSLRRPQLPPADPPLEPQGPSSSSSVDSLFGSFEISNSTSYLTDLALDDIFEDIDTSMYDSTDFSTLASPDEGLKPPACTPAGALQLCLADLSELDHIMEVLVRS
ncbi:hypothetical protein COCON_G00095600 [Conger conger]|uniref:SERTA domain-containing protein n=1 Tax=Conger conger TaxID=82655 RepID=A0A9Q1DLV3_CONCO|nr:hypothetical protein COCON_G00095600 [Conger conger]